MDGEDSGRDAWLDVPVDALLPASIGPYRVLGKLGRGGMGQVLDVSGPQGRVALKVAHGEIEARQLEHEDLILRELDHPRIPTSHGLETYDGVVCMPMTRYAGVAFDRRREGDSPRRVVGIISGVLEVLSHVHAREIAHRDLKSSNVLVDGREICLVDFGVAQRFGESSADANGCVGGTAAYMAPEIMDGAPVTAASDLYSVGVLLYRWLTGRWPFAEDAMSAAKHGGVVVPLTVLRPSLPREIEEVADALLNPDPIKRETDAATAHGVLLGLLPKLNERSSRDDLKPCDGHPTSPTLPTVYPGDGS